MHRLFHPFVSGVAISGSVRPDVTAVLLHHDYPRIAGHVARVAAEAPFILHQKLSAAMAREIWGITDEAILGAISCHTTLKADASLLDKVLFVADKIQWDQPGEPPYLERLLAALDHSLAAAAFCYLDYLWQQRGRLRVVHPWFVAAYRHLSANSKQ